MAKEKCWNITSYYPCYITPCFVIIQVEFIYGSVVHVTCNLQLKSIVSMVLAFRHQSERWYPTTATSCSGQLVYNVRSTGEVTRNSRL